MARLQKRKQAAVTTGQPRHPGIPRAMALRLTSRSPQGPALLPLSLARCVSIAAQLGFSTGKPGPHDLTVRTKLFVRMKIMLQLRRAHRIPRSTSVTVAKRPSCEAGHGDKNHNFWKNEREFFSAMGRDEAICLSRLAK
jgi:hypothetical protein